MSRYKEIDIITPTRKMKPLKISSLRCQKYTQISSSQDDNNEIAGDNTESTVRYKKFKAVGIRIQFSAFEKHNKTEQDLGLKCSAW